MPNKGSEWQSKGYCFVRFQTKESADKAVKDSGITIDGKKIGVLPSTEQDLLYLGNIHKEWNADEFEKIVRQAFSDVISVDLALPFTSGEAYLSQKQKNRGFAIVKFSSHAAAAWAHCLGSAPGFLLASLCHPVVQWAELEPEIDPEEHAKVKTAFVRNVPSDADEKYLEKLFEPFGKVDRAVMSKKSRSPVGFVYFATRSDLDRAIKGMNGRAVKGPNGGPPFSLLVEVARPVEKNRKRNREDPQNEHPSKTSTRPALSNDEPVITFGGTKFVTQAQKHLIKEPVVTDLFEAAVASLPVTVRERLLRIMRLSIATRFDIGIQSLTSLKDLPESAAISILDQFMLSGADKHDKAEYLAGLISKVTKLGVHAHNLDVSRIADTKPNEPHISGFSSRVYLPFGDSLSSRAPLPAVDSLSKIDHLPAVDPLSSRVLLPVKDSQASRGNSTAVDSIITRANLPAVDSLSSHTGASLSRYDKHSDPCASIVDRYSSRCSAPLLSGRLAIGRMDEPSPTSLHQTPVSSSSYSRISLYSSSLPAVSNRQTMRSRIRFDPYTGEPYRFDPFTGVPLVPESLPGHSLKPFRF